MESVKNQLGLKLQLNSVEMNEVNIFCHLLSTAMDAIIEYTNESLASKGLLRECFIQVLSNLKGYDVRRRVISAATSTWIDQRNMLDNLHSLEKKGFGCSIEFFYSKYRCLVLDDELVASKASDVENKIVSGRKSGGKTLW
jgi:hypothetical protein